MGRGQMDDIVDGSITKRFKDPELLIKIYQEIDKDHKLDANEKLFIFLNYAGSLLPPKYRVSSALFGFSSVGKDNLDDACRKHIPNGKAIKVTRITQSSIEDDIQDATAISFSEANFKRENGANAPIVEEIKALAEGGTFVIKKDTRKGHREARFEEQERKTVIYSTTDIERDEELATRFCIVSIDGYPSKTEIVNEDTKKEACDYDHAVSRLNDREKRSWIADGLKFFEMPDIIMVPCSEGIEIDSTNSRSQRDLKRFLNIIRVLAFIHQKMRDFYEIDKKKILIASPEDVINAFEISKKIFIQSMTDVESRLQDCLDVMKKLPTRVLFNQIWSKIEHSYIPESLGDGWIKRMDVQKKVNVKSRHTMIRIQAELIDKGLIEAEQPKDSRDVYWRKAEMSSEVSMTRAFQCALSVHACKKLETLYTLKTARMHAKCTGNARINTRVKTAYINIINNKIYNK